MRPSAATARCIERVVPVVMAGMAEVGVEAEVEAEAEVETEVREKGGYCFGMLHSIRPVRLSW
jgi:hypothetical protein